jgi:hypothetical protein
MFPFLLQTQPLAETYSYVEESENDDDDDNVTLM